MSQLNLVGKHDFTPRRFNFGCDDPIHPAFLSASLCGRSQLQMLEGWCGSMNLILLGGKIVTYSTPPAFNH